MVRRRLLSPSRCRRHYHSRFCCLPRCRHLCRRSGFRGFCRVGGVLGVVFDWLAKLCCVPFCIAVSCCVLFCLALLRYALLWSALLFCFLSSFAALCFALVLLGCVLCLIRLLNLRDMGVATIFVIVVVVFLSVVVVGCRHCRRRL